MEPWNGYEEKVEKIEESVEIGKREIEEGSRTQRNLITFCGFGPDGKRGDPHRSIYLI